MELTKKKTETENLDLISFRKNPNFSLIKNPNFSLIQSFIKGKNIY